MSYTLPVFPLPWCSGRSNHTGLSGWACGTCLPWFTWITLKEMSQQWKNLIVSRSYNRYISRCFRYSFNVQNSKLCSVFMANFRLIIYNHTITSTENRHDHVLWIGTLSASSRSNFGGGTLMTWREQITHSKKKVTAVTCGKKRKLGKWKSHERHERKCSELLLWNFTATCDYSCRMEMISKTSLLKQWWRTYKVILLCSLIFTLYCQNHLEHILNTFKITSKQIYP